jgi:hypothetical protein
MKTFSNVEEYLEVIAGKRTLENKVSPNSMFGFGFAPIVNLARYDTDFLDNVTDATLNAQPLTDRQAELALKLIFKYQRQLSAKGINVEPMAVPTYRKPIRQIDRSRKVWIENDRMVLKFPYDTKLIQTLRELLQERQGAAQFNKDEKCWHIALSEFNVNFVVTWAKGNNFEVSTELHDLMDTIIDVEKNNYQIELTRRDGQLVIDNAESSLIEYLEQQGLALTDEYLLQLADQSSILGYTVSSQVWEEVDALAGTDVSTFMRDRTYELTADYGQIPRLFAYARLVNRLPMVVYDPSARAVNEIYAASIGAENIAELGNKTSIKELDAPVIFTHKPIKDVDTIPLLISHVGMLAGVEKVIMNQNSQKIIYYNYKLS